MFNFFFKDADRSLFKRALKSTKDEPVVINILSTDASLKEETKKDEPAPVVRKNLSNKFQPSPFGKFFGPRKQRTTPVDMGNFSSWKNKNFREAEQNIDKTESENTPKFSLADYLNKGSAEKKYNDSDQLTTETTKPIDQLSTDDPTYKKYSLDSYLHKLEEQAKVKDKFEVNDDLLEPLGDDMMQDVIPDSTQDENFGGSSTVNVEDVSFDGELSGERFAFEKSELESVRNRLEKLEREALNGKDKPTEKVLGNELSEFTHDSKFDLSKLGVDDESDIEVDDIEKINEKLSDEMATLETEQHQEPKPQVKHKTFFEINKTPTSKPTIEQPNQESEVVDAPDLSDLLAGDSDEPDETIDATVEPATDEPVAEPVDGGEPSDDMVIGGGDIIVVGGEEETNQEETQEQQTSGVVSGKKVGRDDILTKDDLRAMTDELVDKFTEMYKKGEGSEETTVKTTIDEEPIDELGVVDEQEPMPEPYIDDPTNPYGVGEQPPFMPAQGQPDVYPYGMQGMQQSNQLIQQQQAELQAKILEMIEANRKSDAEAEEKLRQAELEKQKVAEQYEARLKELEESFKKRDEELKKQAYLDKLKSDIKLKKAETNFRRKEEELKEIEKVSSERVKIGLMLKKELENNLNISNLEMDKKLLEVASKIKKEEESKQKLVEEPVKKIIQKEIEEEVDEEVDEVEEVEEEKPKTTRKKTTSSRTTSTRRKTGGSTRARTTRSRTRTPRRKIDSDIIGGIDFE